MSAPNARAGMAGTHGNRTHQEPVSRPLTGFEDRAGHQPRTRSRVLWNRRQPNGGAGIPYFKGGCVAIKLLVRSTCSLCTHSSRPHGTVACACQSGAGLVAVGTLESVPVATVSVRFRVAGRFGEIRERIERWRLVVMAKVCVNAKRENWSRVAGQGLDDLDRSSALGQGRDRRVPQTVDVGKAFVGPVFDPGSDRSALGASRIPSDRPERLVAMAPCPRATGEGSPPGQCVSAAHRAGGVCCHPAEP